MENILTSNFECVVECGDKKELIRPFETLIIEDGMRHINVFPVGNRENSLPFSIDLVRAITSPPKNVKIVKSKNYIRLILHEKFVHNGNIYCHQYKIGTATLSGFPHEFALLSKNNKTSVSINSEIKEFDISENMGSVELFAKTVDHKEYFARLCPSKEPLIISGDELSQNKENKYQIQCFKKLKSVCGHGIVQTYNLTDSTSVEHLVYVNSSPAKPNNKELTPLAFLQAIKFDDLSLARSFLSNKLSKVLDDNHLKNFFDNFTTIYHNPDNTYSLCNDKQVSVSADFLFEMDKERISNIENIS